MKRKKDKSQGITALYERLSRDDENVGDSNSIIHQKQMLEDYAAKNNFTNIVHYTDDGWSGASFDRPAWNRLVDGVKNGEITTVIVKDLSRVGRDHLQVGFFTDILFREKEVRFIAIGNSIDSDQAESSEFAPFLNIMNEWYVRDTSKKIRSVLKARGNSGKAHTTNVCIYGYRKDPNNPDQWIIDQEAAAVVKRIFQMTIEGKGPYQIANILREEKVERPSYYLSERGWGNNKTVYDRENPYCWCGTTVAAIIRRKEYAGYTVNFKTYTNSYKDKRPKNTPDDQRAYFEGTQEPIVDLETWELCQKLRTTTRRPNHMGDPNPFTGILFCAECGAPLYNHRNNNPRVREYFINSGERRFRTEEPEDSYTCSTYTLSGQKFGPEGRKCTIHSIRTANLKKIVLAVIKETCAYVALNEQEFIELVNNASDENNEIAQANIKKRIQRSESRLAELDRLIRRIYEDNVSGRLSDRLFDQMMTDYEQERADVEKALDRDKESLDQLTQRSVNTDKFIQLVRKYTDFSELTPAMLNEFVSKIVIHEAVGKGADRTMDIDVYLNYIGQFQVPKEEVILSPEEEAAQRKEREKLERKRESDRRYMKKYRERQRQSKAMYEARLAEEAAEAAQ